MKYKTKQNLVRGLFYAGLFAGMLNYSTNEKEISETLKKDPSYVTYQQSLKLEDVLESRTIFDTTYTQTEHNYRLRTLKEDIRAQKQHPHLQETITAIDNAEKKNLYTFLGLMGVNFAANLGLAEFIARRREQE